LRGDRFGSGLGYRIERPALVSGVTLHCFDEIRHQISATFELDVDVRPGVLGPDAE